MDLGESHKVGWGDVENVALIDNPIGNQPGGNEVA